MLNEVDLEKAYDRLNWSFIYETLCLVGLPIDLIGVIMECITSVSMQILWNGELTESPSRGLDKVIRYLLIFLYCALSV